MAITCFRLKGGKTVHSWCKENNVQYRTVWFYLDKGFTPEDACDLALKVKGSHKPKHFYKGELVCRLLGGSHSNEYKFFIKKIKQGFSVEEAFERVRK